MAPPSGLHQSAISSGFEKPFPALVRSSTVPASLKSHRADPSHLAPEDAYTPISPPRQPGIFDTGADTRPRHIRRNDTSRSRSRRRKRFQKLLWVKQSYPDNYTDQATFLENLQRNPRVQPYDFWPLVADSTVILQHVCSVIIFIVCFVGIFQERVSPVSVVGWGSFATFLGWLLWDWWMTQEDQTSAGESGDMTRSMRDGRIYREYRPPRRQDSTSGPSLHQPLAHNISTASISSTSNLPSAASSTTNLLQYQHRPHPTPHQHADSNSQNPAPPKLLTPGHSHSRSVSSVHSVTSQNSANSPTSTSTRGPIHDSAPDSLPNTRAYLRVSTIKSAILIYFTLLGLSPILKSLTRSTSSDSIWAMSFWLLAINIFFFDYSGGTPSHISGPHKTKKMPVASLSTNAALMASTVLASRLPSTGQVFSLTLFSIEVFGLFPVFRSYARHKSWRYHVLLTVLLVLGAGGGVGIILGEPSATTWPWKRGLAGMVIGCLISAVAIGGCSWWLIGMQKYKNEIYGPWDPARPIIISRRHWDDD